MQKPARPRRAARLRASRRRGSTVRGSSVAPDCGAVIPTAACGSHPGINQVRERRFHPVRGPMRFLVVVGTRPEAIKLAPVVLELARHSEVTTICSGQHTTLAREPLDWFGIKP